MAGSGRWAALALLLFAADQALKAWAERGLSQVGDVPLLGTWLMLALRYNPGASFSVFAGLRVWLAGLGVAALAAAAAAWRYGPRWFPHASPRGWRLALVLAAAGTAGNLVDRLWRGAVVDYLALPFWPVFNLADVFLTVGCFLLAWQVIKGGASGHGGTGSR